MVARDRWTQTPTTLDLLIERTDPRHDIVLVDAHAPRDVARALDRRAATGRVRVVRRNRHLAANTARNLGVDGARTEWIAFVENDVVLDDGWLEELLAAGEARDATSVYPAYLQPSAGGFVVHGLGADLELCDENGQRFVHEHQVHLNQPWCEIADRVEPATRVQSEYHTMAIRREFLDRLGGLDEQLLSWFDHTDLALHHLALGASAWFVPTVTCRYLPPPPVALRDVPSFLLRWSHDWYQRSLDRLCEVWGFDPSAAAWKEHDRYRKIIRRGAFTQHSRVDAVLDRAAVPGEHVIARWNARGAGR